MFELATEERTPLQQLVPALAALTDGILMSGNEVRVIRNGAFFDALLDDVAAATSSVHLENYLWKSGRICDRVIATLAAKAGEGVAVRVLHDRLGARHAERDVFQPLREAGCETVRHRPSLPLSLAAQTAAIIGSSRSSTGASRMSSGTPLPMNGPRPILVPVNGATSPSASKGRW